jgi:MATE family multidrug resistance protein
MVVSRAGLAAMVLVDAVAVARYDAGALAVTILAQGTFGRLVDVFLAVLLSPLVLFAAAQGPGNGDRRIALWHRSLALALGLGLAGFGVAVFATPILSVLGQDPALAKAAGPVVLALGIGLPAGLVAIASAIHLEGAGRAKSVALSVLAANGLNLGLNGVLVGGHLGFPELGALGSAVSTSLVRLTLAAVLVWSVLSLEGPAALRRARPAQSERREQMTLGGSAFVTAGLLHALGIWLTVFAGWFGPLPLAAYASAWLLNLPGMLLSSGIGDALALRLSKADAEGASRREAARLFRSDLGGLALVLLPFTVLFSLWPVALAGLYTSDPSLATGIAALLPASGLVLLLDGLSYGLVAALRARRDVAVPMAIQIGCMAATPVLAGSLAFGLDLGLSGIVAAILSTSTLRIGLLAFRIHRQFRARSVPFTPTR